MGHELGPIYFQERCRWAYSRPISISIPIFSGAYKICSPSLLLPRVRVFLDPSASELAVAADHRDSKMVRIAIRLSELPFSPQRNAVHRSPRHGWSKLCELVIWFALSIRSRLTRLSESRRSSRRRWGRTGRSRTGSAWEPTIRSGL